MERRRAGLLIVVLVLLAAVVMPRFVGRQVIGFPTAAAVPGAPAIGDCLLEAPSPSHGVVSSEGQAIYQDLRTSPCSGGRFGEIAAVLPHGLSVRATRVADDYGVFSFDDPNRHLCLTAMVDYLDRSSGTSIWRPSITFESAPLRPTELQQRFGQDWVACAIFVTGRTGTVLHYTGTVRDNVGSGLAPDATPDCLSSKNYFVQHPVDCTQPHPLEAFGLILTHDGAPTGRGGRATTELSIASACSTVVAAATGMPDPTGGGQLQVTAAAVHRASDGTFAPGLSTQDELGTATCVAIATSGQLTGSLRGLGDGPVPLA